MRLRALACSGLLLLGACVSTPPRTVPTPAPPKAPKIEPPEVHARPPDASAIPDAVPRAEPRSARGNPPFYDVLGKRYFVLSTADGYLERGVTSWYVAMPHDSVPSGPVIT